MILNDHMIHKKSRSWLFLRCSASERGYREKVLDMKKFGCVLLKGGRSSRMGGNDKAELLYRGISFKERIRKELEQSDLPLFLSEAQKAGIPR